MPSIEQNRDRWGEGWERRRGGERWSRPWGGSEMHWHVGILPRLQRWLPAHDVVEIGPGRGRWSRRLRPYCDRLTLIDLDPGCVGACQALFAEGVLQHRARLLPGEDPVEVAASCP